MHPLEREQCEPRCDLVFRAGGEIYKMGGAIGNGAVGLVRKAMNVSTTEVVALKLLAPDPKYIDVSAFDDVRDRFRREGMRGAGLHHENLVKIIAYEDNAGGECFIGGGPANPFILVEFVRGRTVEDLIKVLGRDGPTDFFVNRQTLAIAVRLCRALRHLHERAIVHRDVKPANVFVSTTVPGAMPSEVKVGDFGVTKWGDFLAATTTGTLTMSHHHGLGTLKYMSPEQALKPKEVTARSDMFALGITLFELFSGRVLPSTHHVYEIVMARNMRGDTFSRLRTLGMPWPTAVDEAAFEPVFDMFLSAKSRPSSRDMIGRYEFLLDRLSE